MKYLSLFLIFTGFLHTLVLCSCASHPIENEVLIDNKIDYVSPSWKNLHKEDPELAGIYFLFEGVEKEYEIVPEEFKLHPPGVVYLFWDGRCRITNHLEDGTLQSSNWSKIGTESTKWAILDYRYGSDPKFRTFPDFRKNIPNQSIAQINKTIQAYMRFTSPR